MYIKEIIIEGFKSYAQQTTVSPFDPHFNAITGLNGSGKSNILDSICFLLGISNLSHVRATNLQELIYKGGNAGITKASVSITFDNSDTDRSPPGYQEYEEITITRQISCGNKHKYLINGQNATAQRVTDLFCSVQLNVNNPNFLIMQGKIMKVLNMKPVEILSMIEEAAGTKTYDVKKANALQTIEKKNAKLNEIERVLKEDITPVIEKLKQERSSYIEYQQCEREFLHLQKITIAYQFHVLEETLNKNKLSTTQLENEYKSNLNRIEEIDTQIDSFKKELDNFVNNLSKNGSANEELNKHEAEYKKQQVELTKLNSEMKNLKSNVNAENKRRQDIENNIKENNNMIEVKQKKLIEIKEGVGNFEQELVSLEDNLKKAQKQYEALCCGFVVDEDTSELQTIQDQLLNTKTKISQYQTQIKKAEIILNNALKENEKLKSELTSDSKTYQDTQKLYDTQKVAVDKQKEILDSLNFDSNMWDTLNTQKRNLNAELYNLNERIQGFYNEFPRLNFEYKDPEPNFDRSRVKGLVCNLFKIKDSRFATALEVAGGGKLYNLVVDTDRTGKLILERGELRRKVTIIPMNQIKSHVISDNVINTAKSLVGADNVHSALSLIDYEPVYRPVMEYVFGSCLVCFSLENAKHVAFHPQVMTNTITIDGDHFNPDGILTGGARGEQSNILQKMVHLKENISLLNQKNSELSRLEQEINEYKRKSIDYSRLKQDYDIKLNQLNMTKLSLEQTSYYQKKEKSAGLDTEIVNRKEEIQTCQKDLENLTHKLKDLEKKVTEGSNLEEDKKNAQKKIDDAKALLEKKTKSSNDIQQECKTINVEIDVLNKEIEAFNEEIEKIKQNIDSLNDEINVLQDKIDKEKEEENNILERVNNCKEQIKERNMAIDARSKEIDKLEKEKNSIQLAIKELDHKKKNLIEQLAQSTDALDSLVETNEWINEEKKSFGKENTIYDFKKQNMKELHYRLNTIKNRKDKLSKQVDMRNMGMLAKKEEEYEELNKKRLVVLKDRSTLETTIEDLEKIKTQVLQKAFESINKDLGNIFKTLLPGAFAKLEPVNRASLADGVEFKVAFGDVWKESLTELSGGQRSLVALSLILSLLLFKPAPLYILDEVDAALDTSHTQNIGLMIKKYFKHSQFIIVSLKDGMFNNANVLFRTKLIDGVSTVQRYEQKKRAQISDKENNNSRYN